MSDKGKPSPEAIFFASAEEFRAWLEEHAAEEAALWVGFHKKRSGRPSISYPEAVDQALCYGWIDGVRNRVDDDRYANRFTPRRARSNWSAVNVKRVQELTALGLMRPAGLEAFARRGEREPGGYSFEQPREVTLGDDFERQFRANEGSWSFFQAQPAWYRKAAIWWVVSAKKEETRRRRLETLIADSAQGRTIRPLTRRT